MKRTNLLHHPIEFLHMNHRSLTAGFISAIVIVSVLSVGIVIWKSQPMISTCYFHFNLQYRAGNVQSYDDIITNSFEHIIWMFGNHTSWNYTVECQLLLLNYVYLHYPALFEDIQHQNQAGQLELIIDQYSDSFQVPYPSTDFRESIIYTEQQMELYNLTQSELVLLQEGQWLPAIGQVFDANPHFKAAIVSIEQCGYFNYFPSKSVAQWTLFGKTINAFIIPWVPIFQDGMYWQQIYTQDGEKINTGGEGVNLNEASGFSFNPLKQSNLEARLIELEQKGNQFKTLGQFYDQLVQDNQIEVMNQYVPETEWVAAQYKQYYTWMGRGGGATDDGSLLARLYFTQNLIQDTQILLDKANQTALLNTYPLNQDLLLAKLHLWNATVTDTTGINPDECEFQYGLDESLAAQNICWYILSQIKNAPGSPYSGIIQILPYNDTVLNNSDSFVLANRTQSTTFSEIDSTFHVNVTVEQGYDSVYPTINNTEIREIQLNGKSYDLYTMDFSFRGQYNINITNGQSFPVNMTDFDLYNKTTGVSSSNFVNIGFQGNWVNACYSPALAENYTVNLNRDDYLSHPYGASKEWVFLLSMCNGFLYNPQDQYAIIKNCTVSHLAAKWNDNQVVFQTDGLLYSSSQEYFLVKGNLTELLNLANFINTYQPLVVGGISYGSF